MDKGILIASGHLEFQLHGIQFWSSKTLNQIN